MSVLRIANPQIRGMNFGAVKGEAQSGTYGDYWKQIFNKIGSRGEMSAEMIQDLMHTADAMYTGQLANHRKFNSEWDARMQRRGLIPENTRIDVTRAGAGESEGSGSSSSIPSGAKPTGKTSGGKPVYQLPNGDLAVEE
jgi:hypothetical protein